MKVIGITGPTGAGKTTALHELKALGGCILDADAIYHQLLEGQSALRTELEHHFGPLSQADGAFDRKRLGEVVFHDPEALQELNAIAHRYVVEEIEKQLEQARGMGCPAAAIDAIGLFESGADRLCQETVAILAPPSVRIRRIMDREGISESYAKARVSSQQEDTFYRSQCNYVLENDCADAQTFAARARVLFEELLGTV